MKIAIIGYGKMGKTIERIAIDRGHEIVIKIGLANLDEFTIEGIKDSGAKMAIEFTGPSSALDNIKLCFDAGVKVVSGSTAWLDHWDEAIMSMETNNGAFIYASNFSIGVNIFFALNRKLAQLMNTQSQYDISIREIHHTAKLDAPSGTGITLAEGIIDEVERKSGWAFDPSADEILMDSVREDPAPGTHEIKYASEIDEIDIIHTAKSRDGFALGAVLAAEFLIDNIGLKTMKDVLSL